MEEWVDGGVRELESLGVAGDVLSDGRLYLSVATVSYTLLVEFHEEEGRVLWSN